MTLSFAAFHKAKHDIEHRLSDRFTFQAIDAAKYIQSNLNSSLNDIFAIRGFVHTTDRLSHADFRKFASSLRSSAYFQAIQWIPKVTAEQREAFESAMRRQGDVGFVITETGPDGVLRPAAARAFYFPVTYLTPRDGNEAAFGFDLASNSVRKRAMDQAQATAEPVATGRITVVQEAERHQYAFLVFLPVYENATAPADTVQGQNAIKGYAVGEIRVADAMTVAAGPDIDRILLFDESAPAGQQRLYPYHADYASSRDISAQWAHKIAFEFAGRQWTLAMLPPAGYYATGFTPWLVLLAGMGLTGLILLSLFLIASRKIYAEALAQERTEALRKKEIAQQDAMDALLESNRMLEVFACAASHDLKAPLRGINNLISWIINDQESRLSSDSLEHATRLQERSKRLGLMLDGLLNYARASHETSNGRNIIQSVDVSALCRQITDYIAPPEGFTVTCEDPLPVFETAAAALETVLSNLIANAIKHHDRPAGTITISCRESAAHYCFEVADDGPGIPAKNRKRIFDLFHSVPGPNKANSTGIGLSIVKRLVETAQGRVWLADNTNNRGTTFCFKWPKSWPHAARAA